MSKWQPIETAPKDGTRVLLTEEWGVVIGRWCEEAQLGLCEEGPGWQVFECDDCWYSVAAENPTHWMPLPAPPTE